MSDLPVPVQHEPMHRLVFSAGTTRILDVRIPAGATTLYHTHSAAICYVPISVSPTRAQPLGGDWIGPDGRDWAIGAVRSIAEYAHEPHSHRVGNVGEGLFHLVAIENAAPPADPTALLADGPAPVLSNPWFTAWRTTLAPGEQVPPRQLHDPVVVVQVSPGRLTVARDDGTSAFLAEPGAWAWNPAPVSWRLRNDGDRQVTVVSVEVRNG